jgi:hypothetical protein
MIECSFTLDYEIYGNGTGAVRDLIYEPAERLRGLFRKWQASLVTFVEVLELEKIEAYGSDPAIDLAKRQIRELFQEGCEIGLHLHPQWSHGRYEQGQWFLDASEYNLCVLPRARISEIVEGSLRYLRYLVNDSQFTPISFRAGNWLFQPTRTAAQVLAENGIRLDSSVFKGGVQHRHRLDYRRAMRNGYYWQFFDDVNEPDPAGSLLEVPVYAEMVPVWRMPTSKRLGHGAIAGMAGQSAGQKLNRLRDFLRFRYPLKLDFCRMSFGELTDMMDRVIQRDLADSGSYRPIVAIGHTKDLTDLETVDAFLSYLRTKDIPIVTLSAIYSRLSSGKTQTAALQWPDEARPQEGILGSLHSEMCT